MIVFTFILVFSSRVCLWLQLLQLLLPGSLWAPLPRTLHPAASVPLPVSSRRPTQSCNMPCTCSWFYILIHSKEQVRGWQSGVSSSNANLAERHRRLLWWPPKEAWEGKPKTPGGWGWWRGWRKWDVKGQQEVSLNNYRFLHKYCFLKRP